MEYIAIRNWERWQSYRKDRGQPPWIKIHRRVMRNPEWVSLSDAERGQLVAIWLLAADHDGVIPASPEVVQKLCFMSKCPDFNKFSNLGFLASNGSQLGVNLASNGSQCVTPKAEAEENRIEEILSLGSFKNVKLHKGEYESLVDKFGKPDCDRRIETLSEYIASKGKKYKSHYATILSWARKDGIPDKKNDPNKMICRNCGHETSALVDGICWTCKEGKQ